VAVFTQLATPVELLVSRRIEARADVHALDLARDPTGQIAMQHRLAVANLADLDPDPIVYGLFASHPTPPERIAIARDWAKIHGVSSG
jgi:STE24 endopeptidase